MALTMMERSANARKGFKTSPEERKKTREYQRKRRLEKLKQRVEEAGFPVFEPPKPDVAINEPNIRIPRAWGELNESAKFEDEVEWVHQNRILVIGYTKGGILRLDWHLASTPAPSRGAMAMLQSAANNPQWFDRDILPKVKRGVNDSDTVLTEKKTILEIEMVLERMLMGIE